MGKSIAVSKLEGEELDDRTALGQRVLKHPVKSALGKSTQAPNKELLGLEESLSLWLVEVNLSWHRLCFKSETKTDNGV